MNQSINKVTLIGSIISEPKLKLFESNKAICTLQLVTLDTFIDSKTGQQKSTKDFHTVIFWGELAKEISKKCSENDSIYIEGKLKYSSWETKDGIKMKTCAIYAENYLVFQKTQNETDFQYPPNDTHTPISPIIEFNSSDLDELPF